MEGLHSLSRAKSVRTFQTASLLASISTVVSIVRLGIDVFCEEAGHDGDEFAGHSEGGSCAAPSRIPSVRAPRLVEAVSFWGWAVGPRCGVGCA